MNRYSAITIFDKDLDRVVLIEKQKPAWQAGRANFPGGKVELQDWPLPNRSDDDSPDYEGAAQEAHLTCAIRELAEETSLVVNPNDVKHFATLRFTTDGQPGECRFFCCIGDVDAAATKEQERIFVDSVGRVEKKAVQPQHSASCRQTAVAVECKHGFDFCPTCDACNCEVSK